MKDKQSGTVYYMYSYEEMKDDYFRYVLTDLENLDFKQQEVIRRKSLKLFVSNKLYQLF